MRSVTSIRCSSYCSTSFPCRMHHCSAGAELQENSPVTDAVFDSSTGLWTVTIAGGELKHSRVLVCADGAQSELATQLGIVKGPPKCVGSRAYIKGGTHRFKEDGMVFYVPTLLPGRAFTCTSSKLFIVHFGYDLPIKTPSAIACMLESSFNKLATVQIKLVVICSCTTCANLYLFPVAFLCTFRQLRNSCK